MSTAIEPAQEQTRAPFWCLACRMEFRGATAASDWISHAVPRCQTQLRKEASEAAAKAKKRRRDTAESKLRVALQDCFDSGQSLFEVTELIGDYLQGSAEEMFGDEAHSFERASEIITLAAAEIQKEGL